MTGTYVPGTLETDPKKLIYSLQQLGPKTDTNTAAIATLNAATYVNSIGGRTGVITLNSTSGITNSSNDIILSQGSASQFGAVKVDGTTITASSGVITAAKQGWVLLNTLTASNSATLSDTSNITNTYSEYEIIWTNLIPATNATTLELQVHAGGTFKSTGYLGGALLTSGAASANNSSTTFIQMSQSAAVFNGAPGSSGRAKIYNPTASAIIQINGDFINAISSSGFNTGVFGGYWNTSGAIDGFQILFSSGNITSGVVKLYGRV